MASRKKLSSPVYAPPDSDSLEYSTQVGAVPSETLPVEPVPDRETQIREAAYAAYERRGGQGGDTAQDWLDAEAEWERLQKLKGRLEWLLPSAPGKADMTLDRS